MIESLCFFLKWSIICGFVAKRIHSDGTRREDSSIPPAIEETQKSLIIIINYFWCDVCDAMLMPPYTPDPVGTLFVRNILFLF